MKKNLLLVLCTILALSSFAQTTGVKWEQGTFQEALDKAAANKKGANLVFLDCYTTWCGPCKNMANNVFPTKEAGDYFNKYFVNIKIDMEKGEGIELAKKYSVSAYPTFLILETTGAEVGRVVGGGGLNDFIKQIENAKDIKNSHRYAKEVYESDKSFSNALAYMKALEASSMNAQIADFIADNLLMFNQNQIFSPQMWRYFSQNIAGDNPALLNYLLKNKVLANTIIGNEVVDKTIMRAYSRNLTKYLFGSKSLTKEEIQEAAKVIKLLAKDGDKLRILTADIAILYADKNIEEISKIYQFNKLSSYNMSEIQEIERIFGAMKEVTKEQIEQYYKEKADFYTKQIEGCNVMMGRYLKNK